MKSFTFASRLFSFSAHSFYWKTKISVRVSAITKRDWGIYHVGVHNGCTWSEFAYWRNICEKKKKIMISVNIFKDEKYMYILHLFFCIIFLFSVSYIQCFKYIYIYIFKQCEGMMQLKLHKYCFENYIIIFS